MELNNSVIGQQTSPNFGMALRINKKAEPFIETLSTKERRYLKDLGNRIKNSRNDINIDEFGKISLTYRPRASEIRLVNESERESLKAKDKAYQKKYNSEITTGEKLDILIDSIKTYAKAMKIKMSLGKSKFMKDLQVKEEFHKAFDKGDAFEEKIRARVDLKDSIAQKETKNLISEFCDK